MRIIAGRFKGRRLVAPPGTDTRPTQDRIKEALFSILGDLSGARVADLYAGTGGLGLEALSRGASHVTFVEQGRPALRALEQNVAELGVTAEVTVLKLPVARALAGLAPCDLVLLDPPYAIADVGAILDALPLTPAALVVLETSARRAAPEVRRLAPASERTYGDTKLVFYGRKE